MPEVQLLNHVVTTGGESPVWDVEDERLFWIDNTAGVIFRSTADGGEVATWRIPRLVTSIAVVATGELLLTSGRRILAFDPRTGDLEDRLDRDHQPASVFNDGKVDRAGRFVTGTVDPRVFGPEHSLVGMPPDPVGHLYCFDSASALHELVGGIGITNGPCFSRDGRTLLCSDSAARRVYAFDYVDGSVTYRRTLAAFPDDDAVPDGATVDADDCLWVAAFGAGEVRRFSPDGELLTRLPLPVDRPTSVMFGGPDLDVLYVTSQAGAAPSPVDGHVLALHDVGARGLPERRFGA